MKAVVLAGGLGTRLRERLPDLPKPMAPVGKRPFLEYLLDHLIAGGIRDILLSIGYRFEAIQEHFGASYRDATIRYAIETKPLGTGGAIVNALRGEQKDAPALVLNGDTLLTLDYGALINWYEESPWPIAMALTKVADVSRYGAVMVNGERVTGFAQRGKSGPGVINAGVYILCASVFSKFELPDAFSFESELLQPYCGVLNARAYVTDSYFIDIGIPEDLDRARREVQLLIP